MTLNTLDTTSAEFLEQFGSFMQAIAHLTPAEKREQAKQAFTVPEEDREPIESVKDVTIDGPNGEIPLRIFRPSQEKALPTLVYFHHGGWVFGSLDECDPVCRRMAKATNSLVIAVDYRLAPEHKFPAPVHDAYAASQWAYQHALEYGGDPGSLTLIGESAGGNLASVVCMMARERNAFPIARQVLLYPILTCDFDPEAYENNPDEHLLTWENMVWFREQYLNTLTEKDEIYASPIKSPSLQDLPPALIIAAEWDPLRFEAAAFAEKLKEAGVPVQHHCVDAVVHGFLGFPIYPAQAAQALENIRQFIH